MATLMPWPLKLIVDYALGGQPAPYPMEMLARFFGSGANPAFLIMFAGAASLALYLLNALLNWGTTWNWATAGYRMVYDLAADMLSRLQRLSLRYHGKRPVGDMLTSVSEDCWCTYKLAANLLVSPTQHLFTISMVGAVAWSMNPQLSLLLLVSSPILVISPRYFGQRLKQRTGEKRKLDGRMTSFVHQTLTSIPIVKVFNRQARNRQQFGQIGSRVVSAAQKSALTNNSYQLVNGFAITTGTALVIYVGGGKVIEGALSLGDLLVFIAYGRTLTKSLRSLLDTYAVVKEIEVSVDRVIDILDSRDEVPELPDARPFKAANTRDGLSVEFRDVTFGYDRGKPILKNIDLTAPAGNCIALVGATGAGKTTLASLIPRFFDPWEGGIYIDGHDIREMELESLRRLVAMVLQDHFLLPMSIAENIAYGRPDATMDEIAAAAKAANAEEFIRHLPKGYDTVIGERGARLSGGQKQRLSIARALLKDSPILILDEPTASLDAKTESLILDALGHLKKGRTTFIIAHRASTIRDADKVVVLDGGTLLTEGPPDSLRLASSGPGEFSIIPPEDSPWKS